MFCLPLRQQSPCGSTLADVPQRAGFRLFAPPPSDDDICNIFHPLSVLRQRPACHTMFTSGKTKRRAGACLTGGTAPCHSVLSTSQLLILMFVSPSQDQSTYKNGKAVHTIKVVPRLNLTVTCTVTNKFGEDVRSINVSSGTQIQSKLL